LAVENFSIYVSPASTEYMRTREILFSSRFIRALAGQISIDELRQHGELSIEAPTEEHIKTIKDVLKDARATAAKEVRGE
jgi:translation initiation factor 2 alpha subunit (eIF-2alpha)